MRVVVTGGAGFIGANLVRALEAIDDVDEIIAFDDLSTGFRSNLEGLGPKVEFVEASILDAAAVARAVDGASAVVHLAARPSVPRSIADPVATHSVNATGTITILEAVRGQRDAPQVIFASSSSVYGANPVLPKREDLAPAPRSPYAASKLAAEAYVLSYQDSFGVPVLPFRFFNVYGPMQMPGHAYAAVVPTFLHDALLDRPVPVHGDGLQTRDFTYVGTVVDVISRAVVRRVTSSLPVNLAFGTRSTLVDVLAQIEQMLGRNVAREHLPARAGDVRDSQACNDRLRELFPDIEPVDLTTGLAATLDWMRDQVGM